MVTFDARAGRTYVGKVIAVAPSGTLTQGVVTYPVSLSIEPARFGPGGNTQGLNLGTPQSTAAPAGAEGAQPPASPQATTGSQGQTGAAGAQGAARGAQGQAGGQGAGRGTQGQPTAQAQAPGSPQAQAPSNGQAQGQGQQASPLLPAGLTANVVITIAQKENVLNLPSRAVRRQGRDQVVSVVAPGGKTEIRVVRTGVTSDTAVEIVEGLSEGEQVLIPTTTARQPSVGGGIPGASGGGAGFVGKPGG